MKPAKVLWSAFVFVPAILITICGAANADRVVTDLDPGIGGGAGHSARHSRARPCRRLVI